MVPLILLTLGCAAEPVETSHRDRAMIGAILEDVRVGWEQGPVVDTDNRLTTSDGRDIHNRGHGTYLFRWIDGAWKVVHTQSGISPVR